MLLQRPDLRAMRTAHFHYSLSLQRIELNYAGAIRCTLTPFKSPTNDGSGYQCYTYPENDRVHNHAKQRDEKRNCQRKWPVAPLRSNGVFHCFFCNLALIGWLFALLLLLGHNLALF